VGDLCFVEYRIAQDPNNNANPNFLSLTRNFVGSAATYAAVKNGGFPSTDASRAEVLAANVVPNRRVLPFNTEITDVAFTALGTDGKPVAASARPAIIDVTISTADEETVRTLDITNKQLRTVGYFSFRAALPKP
jgi:hypothetical protein